MGTILKGKQDIDLKGIVPDNGSKCHHCSKPSALTNGNVHWCLECLELYEPDVYESLFRQENREIIGRMLRRS